MRECVRACCLHACMQVCTMYVCRPISVYTLSVCVRVSAHVRACNYVINMPPMYICNSKYASNYIRMMIFEVSFLPVFYCSWIVTKLCGCAVCQSGDVVPCTEFLSMTGNRCGEARNTSCSCASNLPGSAWTNFSSTPCLRGKSAIVNTSCIQIRGDNITDNHSS